ncbi:hypothetical protein I79_013891 [Cricetulus griseus]|uniref:Uncharacterized protein n=1 Tax=Cricetulus griseus TaxID=10029 RepID=G3HSQ0_CRIGR|nr:hypothetical protein I79_013891 [Cricetulus griseus]
MAQRLRAPTVLPEVLSSIPSNHMMAHNHLLLRSGALFWCAEAEYMEAECCIHNK